MHHSEAKKILGRGQGPLPRPLPHWGGGAYGASILGALSLEPSALNLGPQTKILDPPVCVESKKFLILYYAGVMWSYWSNLLTLTTRRAVALSIPAGDAVFEQR